MTQVEDLDALAVPGGDDPPLVACEGHPLRQHVVRGREAVPAAGAVQVKL